MVEEALKLPWSKISYGGSWDILASNDDIVAVDIPHGAFADHIVNLHNASLEMIKKLEEQKILTPDEIKVKKDE